MGARWRSKKCALIVFTNPLHIWKQFKPRYYWTVKKQQRTPLWFENWRVVISNLNEISYWTHRDEGNMHFGISGLRKIWRFELWSFDCNWSKGKTVIFGAINMHYSMHFRFFFICAFIFIIKYLFYLLYDRIQATSVMFMYSLLGQWRRISIGNRNTVWFRSACFNPIPSAMAASFGRERLQVNVPEFKIARVCEDWHKIKTISITTKR